MNFTLQIIKNNFILMALFLYFYSLNIKFILLIIYFRSPIKLIIIKIVK